MGISQSYYSKIESGNIHVDERFLESWWQAFEDMNLFEQVISATEELQFYLKEQMKRKGIEDE